MLELIKATISDKELFYNWANEPLVRQNAISTDYIPWEVHTIWFETKINSPSTFIYKALENNNPVGQIRFDEIEEGVLSIDYSVDQKYRSKGYGKKLLKLGCWEIEKLNKLKKLVGKVKLTNTSSAAAFKSVGFINTEESQDGYFHFFHTVYPRQYKCLLQNHFKIKEDYTIEPIRNCDRYPIMIMRNEQLYHLRQTEELTIEKQDAYFDNVIKKLFDAEKPDQLLFSYLKQEQYIGYGGLVHINWIDKNAEISFGMQTDLEKNYFTFHWTNFLTLISEVAFKQLHLHKVYTYAYDIRPHLYTTLEANGFKMEAVLKEHYSYKNKFIDIIIHSKFGNES